MPFAPTLRFAFTADGQPVLDGPADMNITYLGWINRKNAQADAWRRFQEWCAIPSPLARRWSCNQVVVS